MNDPAKWSADGSGLGRERVVLFLASLLLSLAMLYNYIFPLKAIMLNRDYVLQLWDLWLVNESLTHLQSPYFTLLQYYPVGAQLGRHVLCPGFFPITFVVQQLSGGDPYYPLYTYRLIIWLAYALIFYFSYLTLRELGLGRGAALIPALSYAFGEFYMNNIVRLHIMAGFFIPLCAYCLIRLYRRPTFAAALRCAVVLALGLYFTELMLFVYLAMACLVIILGLIPAERRRLGGVLQRLGLKTILAGVLAAVLIGLPFGYQWLAAQVEPPDPGTARRLSANLAAFFIPKEESTPLYGGWFNGLSRHITVGHGEFEQAFIGFPLLIFGLAAVATIRTRNKIVWIAALMALIFFGLSLGPTLKLFSLDTQWPLPYALFGSIPPFNMGRTPIRFVVIALFFWMIVAGFGLQRFQEMVTRKFNPAADAAALALVLLWAAAEAYSPTPAEPPYTVPPQLQAMTPGPVIQLPLKFNDGWSLLLQMFHHQPMASGYVSRSSRQQKAHFRTLEVLYAEALQTGSCQKLEAMGYRNVIVSAGVADDVVFGLTHSPNCHMQVIDLRR